MNLSTGHVTTWQGIALGPYGAGFVNGLAVDSATGIAATTTELNAQVEFYDLQQRTGTAVQLPGTGDADQLNSGGAITPTTRSTTSSWSPIRCTRPPATVQSSSTERTAGFVEAITGFHFGGLAQGPTRVAVNPSRRMGWVDGPGIDQLQQFFY